jgi:hypothetical protein
MVMTFLLLMLLIQLFVTLLKLVVVLGHLYYLTELPCWPAGRVVTCVLRV